MIIENFDSLKSWLIQTLTPICDADPDTLAKYVIALVKKEKPHDELKDVCFRELDVFLQDKTRTFVSKLFEALQSNSYLSDRRRSDERPGKDHHIQSSLNEPKALRDGHQNVDTDGKIAPLCERRDQDSTRVDISLSKHRFSLRDHRNEERKLPMTQERRPESDARRLSNIRKRTTVDYLPRPPKAEQSRRAAYRAENVADPLIHSRMDGYNPVPFSEIRDYRHRALPFNRRSEHFERRDQLLLAPKNAFQDFRYQGDRPPRFSPEKITGSSSSARYNSPPVRYSPVRSPQSERADDRYCPARPPWHHNTRDEKNVHPHQSYNEPLRLLRSTFSHGRSRTRSRTSSRTPSRSVDRVQVHRMSRSRSRSGARSRSLSTSLSERSCKSALADELSKVNSDKGVIDSRSSTPLEEEDYKVSDPLPKVDHEVARNRSRPRCLDYDASQVLDHVGPLAAPGPPVLPSMPRPLPMTYQGPPRLQFEGGASYLPPFPPVMTSMAHVRGMDMQPYPSGPPPPAPHLLHSFRLIPPPFIGSRPLNLRPDPIHNQVYQPVMVPVEPYLPEPYIPKSSSYQATPKLNDGNSDADLSYSPQKLGQGQVVANRHTNLVMVPTDAVPSSAEEKPKADMSQNRSGLKRSAEALDAPSDSAVAAAGSNNSVLPPPPKKTVLEHPGVRHGGMNNVTLELRKIPREQNTIANINDHFSKFGIIVNLQVGWDCDSQAALVSFASNAQAQLAYRSQEPFLNNRFIKIFWHNPDKSSQQQSQASSASTGEAAPRQRIVIPERHKLQLNNTLKNAAAKAALGMQNMSSQPVKNAPAEQSDTAEPAASSKPEAAVLPLTAEKKTNPPAPDAAKPAAVQLTPSTTAVTKLQRSTSREMANKERLVKQQLELQKKSQQLQLLQIEQQKILLEKLEKCKATLSAEEKAVIIDTIKKLAKTIEDLKASSLSSSVLRSNSSNKNSADSKTSAPHSSAATARGNMRKINNVVHSAGGLGKPSLETTSPQIPSKPSAVLTYQQAKQAILNTELDLMTCLKEGFDTSELRKRVLALKEEAASLGLLNSKPSSVAGPIVNGSGGALLSHGHGNGSGQATRRWPGASPGASHALDRRPRQLLITGFPNEDKDDLIAHLSKYGEMDNNSWDASVPSLSVSFKSRVSAEQAAVEGCTFKGRQLTMVWQKPNSVEQEHNDEKSSADSAGSKAVAGDVGKVQSNTSNSLSSETDNGLDVSLKMDRKSVEKCDSSDGHDVVMKPVRLDSLTGEEEEFYDDTFLGMDEEDDEDNNEGDRPWRR